MKVMHSFSFSFTRFCRGQPRLPCINGLSLEAALRRDVYQPLTWMDVNPLVGQLRRSVFAMRGRLRTANP